MANIKTDCIAFWSFDKTDRGYDYTRKGHSLTSSNSPTFTVTGGKPLIYANFNGTSNFYNSADAADLSFLDGGGNEIAFFINLWVAPASFPSLSRLINKSITGGNEWDIRLQNNNPRIILFDNGGNTSFISCQMTGTIPTVSWSMLTFAYTGNGSNTGLSIYLNKVLQTTTNSTTGTYTKMINTTTVLQIGHSNNSQYYNGNMDSIGLWLGSPTSDNLDFLYNNGNGRNPFANSGIILNHGY